jgi:hypothetical protein
LPITVTGSTVTGNGAEAATVEGANLFGSDSIAIRDTIVSSPRGGGANCSHVRGIGGEGAPVLGGSEGFNIDDGSSCGFTQPSDHSGVDPGLAPSLADNGGPTQTLALLPGSIAIDAGSAFGATTDQRGTPRPSDLPTIANVAGGDGSDIGAFEASPIASPPVDKGAPNTRIARGPAHRTAKHLAKFRFSSTEPGSHFECKLDKGAFKRCASPFKHKVKPGKHVFRVRAIDTAGNVDETPAIFHWRVRAASRAGHGNR